MIKEFNINFTKEEISLIYQKVKDYPWDSIANLENWDHGTNKEYLKELCNYWVKDFDWGKHELELNKFSNSSKFLYAFVWSSKPAYSNFAFPIIVKSFSNAHIVSFILSPFVFIKLFNCIFKKFACLIF